MCQTKSANVTPFRRTEPAGLQPPPDLRAQVEAYAETHHIGVSEAHRYLIKAGLAAEARAMLESEAVGLEPWCPGLAL